MLKLIRLEWKKNRIGAYVRNVGILAAILCLFIFAMAFLGIARDPDTGTVDAASGNEGISASVELFTGMSFLIVTGAMLASFIVESYKNKTINLMFSYPIKRQKLLIAQMAAVWIFCFFSLALTKLLLYGCIMMGAQFMESDFRIDFQMLKGAFYLQLFVKSAVTVSMGFIALFVGLAMKSSKATVITSALLIFFTQANIGDISLSGNAVFSLVLTGISFLAAVLCVRNAETRDVG